MNTEPEGQCCDCGGCDACGKSRDELLATVQAKIAKRGHHVVAVMGSAQLAPFAYTLGVREHAGCEFAIGGRIPIETMHHVLNTVADRVRAGRLVPSEGLPIEGALRPPYLPRLRRAYSSVPFVLMAAMYGDATPVWQVQWPDKGHRYPGDAGYRLPADGQPDFTRPPHAGAAFGLRG